MLNVPGVECRVVDCVLHVAILMLKLKFIEAFSCITFAISHTELSILQARLRGLACEDRQQYTRDWLPLVPGESIEDVWFNASEDIN